MDENYGSYEFRQFKKFYSEKYAFKVLIRPLWKRSIGKYWIQYYFRKKLLDF